MAAKPVAVKPSGAKGYALEEALRNYFLIAGHYVVRGVPLRLEGEDLTDVDLWLYERPSGSARRRLIVDAKFKNKPKAAERLFWTKGLSEFLGMDAAYVATTDSRPSIRFMARKIGLSVLDGADLNRIAGSAKTGTLERLTGEEFDALVRKVDTERFSKDWSNRIDDVKAALVQDFGASSVNRALSALAYFADHAVVAPPSSDQAATAVRLTFFCASVAAVSLDYVANDAAFRPSEERWRLLVNVIRYGQPDREAGLERVRLASALISQFVENGSAIGRQVLNRFEEEVSLIPAEIIADQVARMPQREPLFHVARELEASAFDRLGAGFDQLPLDAKALMGAFLDFSGIARAKFANATTKAQPIRKDRAPREAVDPDVPRGLLFRPSADTD